MSEMQQLVNMKGKLALNVIQFPVGTWGFVGRVPDELAWKTNSPELVAVAKSHGAGLARGIAKKEGKTFETCTWMTKAEAVAAAHAAGHNVVNG